MGTLGLPTQYPAASTTNTIVVGGESDSEQESDSEHPPDCFSAVHSATHESEE
jgi:hypothetical protein